VQHEQATLSFDLTSEPWIAVRLLDGELTELSLLDAFRRAGEIRDLAGEVPTQTFAIVRLMLAVLYRTLGGSAFDDKRWPQLWDEGLPLTKLTAYLTRWRDRFDLLSPKQPFFQVAELRTEKGETKDVTQLILDLPSNNRLFTTRAGDGADTLSFAEAARWLVNVQAFDTSGIKSGAVGDSRVKGGKGYPIGLAWSGLLGGVLLEGDTLRETLLLNLVGSSAYFEPEGDDLPPWEREPDGPGERDEPQPTGPVSLYTWQSRRVRLFSDGNAIVGSLVCNGDALTPQNGYALGEYMSAWRYSEPQSKRSGRRTYMPREHQAGRAFWRGIGAILSDASDAKGGTSASAALSPDTVQWLGKLREWDRFPNDKVVRLRAIGVIYGSNNSVVDEVIDDRVLLALAVLKGSLPELGLTAETAVRLADEGAWALRRLAENLARAAGGDADGPRQRAEESAYAALDGPFRRWLASLRSDTDVTVALRDWKAEARHIIREHGRELVASSGPDAWLGREVPGRGKEPEILNTARAEAWFLTSLDKTFGKPSANDGREAKEPAA